MKTTYSTPILTWFVLGLASLLIGYAIYLSRQADQAQTVLTEELGRSRDLAELRDALDHLNHESSGPLRPAALQRYLAAFTQATSNQSDAELAKVLQDLHVAVLAWDKAAPGVDAGRGQGPPTLASASKLMEAARTHVRNNHYAQTQNLSSRWRSLIQVVILSALLTLAAALLIGRHQRHLQTQRLVAASLQAQQKQLEDLVAVRTREVNAIHSQHQAELAKRQEAESALRESEGRYRLISELTSDYVYCARLSPDGAIHTEWVTDTFAATTGYNLGEVAGLGGWTALIHPDDLQEAKRFGASLLSQGAAGVAEYRIRHKDGAWRWLRDYVRAEWDNAQGRVVRHVGAVQDVTKRKQAELALEQSRAELERRVVERTAELSAMNASFEREIVERRRAEALYRGIFESAVEGIFQSTPEGRFLAANPALARMWGYDSASDLIRNLTDIGRQLYVTPEQRRIYQGELESRGTVRNFEYRVFRKDGTVRWCSENARVVRDERGKPLYYEGTVEDVTDRKLAEEALRASEAKYRSLIESLEHPVFCKDADLRYVAVNRPFAHVVGRAEEEILGKTDFDLHPLPEASGYHGSDRQVLQEAKPVEYEREIYVEQKPRLLRVVKTPVKDATGLAVGVLGIVWDVTQQRQLEAQLQQAQKMEAIGRLAGGVAHDFNNLLTAILGNLSLALANIDEGDPNCELLRTAEEASNRAAELTRQLLGFSRRAILRTERVSLNVCVQETLRLLTRTLDPRIRISFENCANLAAIKADRAQMGQVIMNLCINACDAMPDGGRLSLQVENVAIDDEYVRHQVGARAGEFVRLIVRDTGLGIPPEIMPRIFEPFFTTKSKGKGTGLGLAMVFGIVKQHQGWVTCTSTTGQGATFEVYLPQEAGTDNSHDMPNGLSSLHGQETILLVDDEPEIRSLGRILLQGYGYKVLLAEDGRKGVEVFRERHRDVGLVILDLVMPRLTGREAMREMLTIDPNACVLFTSGYSEEPMGTDAELACGFIGKPYRPDDLARAVRSAIEQARAKRRGKCSHVSGPLLPA